MGRVKSTIQNTFLQNNVTQTYPKLGNNSKIPIISFSATSPSLTSLRSAYFIRAPLNDSAQLEAVTSIVKAFGWREVVPNYVDNEFERELFLILLITFKKSMVEPPTEV